MYVHAMVQQLVRFANTDYWIERMILYGVQELVKNIQRICVKYDLLPVCFGCLLTCQILTLCVNPVVATATFHHLAVKVIIIVALIAERAEVS